MLDDVHLVDVSPRDRSTDALDRGRVARVVPGALPVADRVAPRRRLRPGDGPDAAGGERQRTRLRRVRPRHPPDGARKRVAEVEVRDEPVGAAAEEAGVAEVRLDFGERVLGPVELKHGYKLASSHRGNPWFPHEPPPMRS